MEKERKEKRPGLEITCEKCGESIPLLHPHIMIERTDNKGNLLCEACYQQINTNKQDIQSL